MEVYIFQAALLCEDCGDEVKAKLLADGVTAVDDDSDAFPHGPFPDGGGEADCPQHCDACRVFLDNPLTGDGENYVIDAFRDYIDIGRGNLDVLLEWRNAYSWCFDHVLEITVPTWEDEKPLTTAQKTRLATLEG